MYDGVGVGVGDSISLSGWKRWPTDMLDLNSIHGSLKSAKGGNTTDPITKGPNWKTIVHKLICFCWYHFTTVTDNTKRNVGKQVDIIKQDSVTSKVTVTDHMYSIFFVLKILLSLLLFLDWHPKEIQPTTLYYLTFLAAGELVSSLVCFCVSGVSEKRDHCTIFFLFLNKSP